MGQKTVVLVLVVPETHCVALTTSRRPLPASGLGRVISEPTLIFCDSVTRKGLICRILYLQCVALEQSPAHIRIPLPFLLTFTKGMSSKRFRKEIQCQQPIP